MENMDELSQAALETTAGLEPDATNEIEGTEEAALESATEVEGGVDLTMELPSDMEGALVHISEAIPEPSCEIEKLDPKGDLILAAGNVRLLVSSKVLQLSCHFFQTMLQPDRFIEGLEQPNSEQPPMKELQEEHPQFLKSICQALHHRPVQPVNSIEELHIFAEVCNFYGCTRAMSFQVQSWTERWDLSTLASSQLQTLLWVSFVFHLHSIFKQVSSRLAQSMTPAEWKAWDVHPMPGKLKGI
jgi:hypothetical protein